jgi:adenylylsulfate kinase-like enzyme
LPKVLKAIQNNQKKTMDSFSSLGFVCWLAGLSGSGKSTIAIEITKALDKLSIPCECLDGEIIRMKLSKGLGFSREDRDINVSRVGFVCSLLNKHGVNSVVAMISPYQEMREKLKVFCQIL